MRKLNTLGPACTAALIAGAVLPALLSVQPAAAFGHSPRMGWMAPGTAKIANRLYVGDLNHSRVLVYTNDANPKMIGQITDGLAYPTGMSVDSRGNLYVANANANDVTVYHQGATTPFLTLGNGPNSPDSVAVANDGRVYVTEFSGDVLEYRAGGTSPYFRIPALPVNNPSFDIYPSDVAVDRAGNLYVYYAATVNVGDEGFVIKYPPGSETGTRLAFRTANANGIDLDHAGNITTSWERSASGSGGVAVFTESGKKLNAWASNLNVTAVRLGVDERRVYATNIDSSALDIYAYPDGHLIRSMQLPIPAASMIGIAVSPAHSH